jgi:CRISPR-associated protein Cas1
VTRHLNTLFITTQGAYLAKEGEAVVVRVEQKTTLRVPIHHLGGIVCFGRIAMSPWLMALCAEAGVTVSFLTQHGRFLAAVRGFTPGNVLLRREQYRRADDPVAASGIARTIVCAKLANARAVLLRGTRDYPEGDGRGVLGEAAERLAGNVERTKRAADLDTVRGIEGEGANTYFGVFNHLLTAQRSVFSMDGRTRRPPADPLNALLSFLYAMLAHDARAACEAAGLDAAVGFLHTDRPGRPGLALDLMEEFRPILADRLALSLVNRQQVGPGGFKRTETGAVIMDDPTRKAVIAAYQKRKQATTTHPLLGEQTTVGLLVHLQARLMARHLRGDLDAYPPYVWR